jgi:hypothetical protein
LQNTKALLDLSKNVDPDLNSITDFIEGGGPVSGPGDPGLEIVHDSEGAGILLEVLLRMVRQPNGLLICFHPLGNEE